MIFSNDQLERFKQYAHRALVRIEEWKNNREVQVGRIAEEIQGAFGEGYYTATHEVTSTPWEFLFQSVGPSANENESESNRNAACGWEFLSSDGRWIIWRRRKAVRELEAKSI